MNGFLEWASSHARIARNSIASASVNRDAAERSAAPQGVDASRQPISELRRSPRAQLVFKALDVILQLTISITTPVDGDQHRHGVAKIGIHD